MRRTPASRPPAAPLRPTASVRRRLALRIAGAALCAGVLTAPAAQAQSGPTGGVLGAVLPASPKKERGFIAKLLKLPSKNASAGRAPGGPPPPPPAPHLKYDFRAAQAQAASRRAAQAAAPTVARQVPAPTPARDEVPRLEAVPPQQMVRQAPAEPVAGPSRSIPVSAESAVGRVTLASPAAASRRQREYVAPRTIQAAPEEPTLVRAPAPPTSATSDDLEFFPEQSEAEADGRFVPPRQVAVQAPAEPKTPTLEPPPTPPRPAPAQPVRSEPARVAAAPVRRPAAPVDVREAPMQVEEAVAEDDGTPFTGLSLTATEPEIFEEPPAPAAAAEPDLVAAAPAAEEGFEFAQTPEEDEEIGWDLTAAAKPPAAAVRPTQPDAAPAPIEEAAEPEASVTVAAAPAKAPAAAAEAPAAPKPQPTAPGRPDPTKLLEKLAARADRSLLMGFCPVTLRDERDLAEGDDRFTAEFEGVTYRFASAEARVKFVADPARYAPAAGGRDLVIASTGWGETVGSLAHAAWYKGRLYLFASRESMRRFVATPRDYLDG